MENFCKFCGKKEIVFFKATLSIKLLVQQTIEKYFQDFNAYSLK